MANSVFPNPPVLPSPSGIEDPATRAWAQALLNALQIYLGQVGQQLGGPVPTINFSTPNTQNTYAVGINNAGNAMTFKKLK